MLDVLLHENYVLGTGDPSSDLGMGCVYSGPLWPPAHHGARGIGNHRFF